MAEHHKRQLAVALIEEDGEKLDRLFGSQDMFWLAPVPSLIGHDSLARTRSIMPAIAGALAQAITAASRSEQSNMADDVARFLDATGNDQLERQFEAALRAIVPSTVPPPAWFDQLRRNTEAQTELLAEFGALTSEQVAELAGSQARNRRATANRWQEEGRIFSVEHNGQMLFLGFQFDQTTGKPKTVVRDVVAALPSTMRGWERALWWTTPSDMLDWQRPVDVVDSDPAAVVAAAEADAADWRQAAGATADRSGNRT